MIKQTLFLILCSLFLCNCISQNKILSADINCDSGKTLAFPEAEGFGKFAKGARAVSNPEIYTVSNLNDGGKGSFRDAVSKPGRFVVFSVSGIIYLKSQINISENLTIAGQTAPGKGVVLYGQKVSFTGANNTITRYFSIRLGNINNVSKNTDASGLANGKNILLDHMSIFWGMDEVFSINWNSKGNEPDSITIQNSIIAQGLHLYNHSAGGLIQTGGHISILNSIYASNKTRNPKVKGKNEFVNNVIYNFGNLGNKNNHLVSGDGYIMGGSASKSEVNIINNYFIAGPLNLDKQETPFSRGTATLSLYESGNFYDDNKNGILDGTLIPHNRTAYPGETPLKFMDKPFSYPMSTPKMSAAQAYDSVLKNAGANFPLSDDLDQLIIDEVKSKGKKGMYVYTEEDLPLPNHGLGTFPNYLNEKDSDEDGIPDKAETRMGLDPNNAADSLLPSKICKKYLNIEIYINTLMK